MRPYLSIAVLLLLAFSFAEEIDIDITTVSDLVRVDSTIDFTSLIPGYDYTGQLSVSWTIPEKSIERIQAKEVPVYVLLSTSENNSIYFVHENKLYKQLSLTLLCVVSDGACSEGSILTKTIEVRASPVQGTNTTEKIEVNASLVPFEEPSILSQIGSAFEELIGQVAEENKAQQKDEIGTEKAGNEWTKNELVENEGVEGITPGQTLLASINENIFILAIPVLIAAIVAVGYIISKAVSKG